MAVSSSTIACALPFWCTSGDSYGLIGELMNCDRFIREDQRTVSLVQICEPLHRDEGDIRNYHGPFYPFFPPGDVVGPKSRRETLKRPLMGDITADLRPRISWDTIVCTTGILEISFFERIDREVICTFENRRQQIVIPARFGIEGHCKEPIVTWFKDRQYISEERKEHPLIIRRNILIYRIAINSIQPTLQRKSIGLCEWLEWETLFSPQSKHRLLGFVEAPFRRQSQKVTDTWSSIRFSSAVQERLTRRVRLTARRLLYMSPPARFEWSEFLSWNLDGYGNKFKQSKLRRASLSLRYARRVHKFFWGGWVDRKSITKYLILARNKLAAVASR